VDHLEDSIDETPQAPVPDRSIVVASFGSTPFDHPQKYLRVQATIFGNTPWKGALELPLGSNFVTE
jgi:hypothetical protein